MIFITFLFIRVICAIRERLLFRMVFYFSQMPQMDTDGFENPLSVLICAFCGKLEITRLINIRN